MSTDPIAMYYDRITAAANKLFDARTQKLGGTVEEWATTELRSALIDARNAGTGVDSGAIKHLVERAVTEGKPELFRTYLDLRRNPPIPHAPKLAAAVTETAPIAHAKEATVVTEVAEQAPATRGFFGKIRDRFQNWRGKGAEVAQIAEEPVATASSRFSTRAKAALSSGTALASTPAPQVPASFIHLTAPEGFVADGHIVEPFSELQAATFSKARKAPLLTGTALGSTPVPEMPASFKLSTATTEAKGARHAAVTQAREARLARGEDVGFSALNKAEAAAKAAPVVVQEEAVAVAKTVEASAPKRGIAARAGEFFKRFKRSDAVYTVSKEATEARNSSMLVGSLIVGGVVAALAFGSSRETERGNAAIGR